MNDCKTRVKRCLCNCWIIAQLFQLQIQTPSNQQVVKLACTLDRRTCCTSNLLYQTPKKFWTTCPQEVIYKWTRFVQQVRRTYVVQLDRWELIVQHFVTTRKNWHAAAPTHLQVGAKLHYTNKFLRNKFKNPQYSRDHQRDLMLYMFVYSAVWLFGTHIMEKLILSADFGDLDNLLEMPPAD